MRRKKNKQRASFNQGVPQMPDLQPDRWRSMRSLANGGIAGEIILNGVGQVQDYLEVFPAARYFIIVYGTNDLGTWPDTDRCKNG